MGPAGSACSAGEVPGQQQDVAPDELHLALAIVPLVHLHLLHWPLLLVLFGSVQLAAGTNIPEGHEGVAVHVADPGQDLPLENEEGRRSIGARLPVDAVVQLAMVDTQQVPG